jgi:ABC-2 type transport system ATP-binding protein
VNIIETHNLTKYYGKNRGILGVDIEVPGGLIYGFIGPNGAGKSTTIRILLSFVKPSSGCAEIFGMDCMKKGREIRKNIGYIPAEVNFYDDMTVSGLLKYAGRLYGRCDTKTVDRLCDMFEIEKSKKIHALSTGNKKKLAIVQAFMHEPNLLIMDEPTSGLDPIMKSNFFELLREQKRKGTTIFFSSHVLSEVQRICDRVAIIKEGSILKVADIDEISETKFKKVRILFGNDIEASMFSSEYTEDIVINGNLVTALYEGDIKDIMKEILKQNPENVWMEEPDLEEIFLNFY